MNRSDNLYKTGCFGHNDIQRETAFHEAGHAAAIYLGNQRKELPPVFFQISINVGNFDFQSPAPAEIHPAQFIAKVEGGRLIQTLPLSAEEAAKYCSTSYHPTFKRAFEADIINLLAGPLAEAKYVALRDNELFNPNLLNLNSLLFYGGLADLEVVGEYLHCFLDSDVLMELKITELLQEAFNFVNASKNWLAITRLADYILSKDRAIIECDEIISVLEYGNG